MTSEDVVPGLQFPSFPSVAVAATKYTSGAPGIVICGTARADNWTGGPAGFEAHYLNTDASGIQNYDMISAIDGGHPEPLKVLTPSAPAAGVAHNFLFVLPVEQDGDTTFGDPYAGAPVAEGPEPTQLTIIEPTFSIDSWYADNLNDRAQQQETFMTTELAPWVKANLATIGSEQS